MSATPLLAKILFFIDEVFVKYYNKISPFLYIVTNCCHKTNAYFSTPPSGTGPWVFALCANLAFKAVGYGYLEYHGRLRLALFWFYYG